MNLVVYRTEVWDLRACHRVCKGVQWRVLVSNISYFILALLPISLSVICQTHCPSARSTNDKLRTWHSVHSVIHKAKILRLSSKASCSHSSIRLHILGRFWLVQLEGQLTEVSHFWMSDGGYLACNTLPDTTWWELGWGLRRLVEDQYTITGRGCHVSSNVPDSGVKVLNEIREDWYWRRAGYICKERADR